MISCFWIGTLPHRNRQSFWTDFLRIMVLTSPHIFWTVPAASEHRQSALLPSDISDGEIVEAKERAGKYNVSAHFVHADFCALADTFTEQFDIVIAMDNALPHMLTRNDLASAIKSIINQMKNGGMFVASIRDYDALLMDKPPYSPPYIHKTAKGQRVSFQTWKWKGDNYRLIQYIVDDGDTLQVSKFECEYRATRRQEMTELLMANGCREVVWRLPEDTGFYQPIVIAKK